MLTTFISRVREHQLPRHSKWNLCNVLYVFHALHSARNLTHQLHSNVQIIHDCIVACWHSSIQLISVDPDLEGPDFIIRQQIFGKMLTDHKAMVRDSEGALFPFARILHLLEEWIKYSDGLSYCLFVRFSLIYSLTTSLVFNYTEHSGRWCLLQPDKPLLK